MSLTHLDYYAALDISPAASSDQIERAYRFALESYGPDSLAAYGVLDDGESAAIVRFLDEARRVLGNEKLRAAYNQQLLADGKYAPAAFIAQDIESPATAEERPAQLTFETPVAAPIEAAPPPQPAPALKETTPTAPATPPPAPVEKTVAAVISIPALDGRPIGGPELREVREARGLRLEDISSQTKISLSSLRFLEEANYKFLPAAVYVKGFLRTYAKILRIDADKVIQDYMAGFDAHRQA